ncbi:hypothetical protein XENTR_v10002636 [Xenopus tropicalis]|uniref:Glutaredoxin-like protein n=1 Tax=Xenopus tropicalis TaxID=8364 RepID=A0A6I8R942_XENTR|nr:hypothetical protein XENTR_v10002636 [Xenopus tropicalis]KAE8635481.1 hypothetical protein XENTR_v10002636 [Xenopus tropicalis]
MLHLRCYQKAQTARFLMLKRLFMSEKERPVMTLFTKFVLEQVDITQPENAAWYDRYKYDIPVFHLNGQFLMMHKVNIKKLEKHLGNLEQQNK